MLRKIFIGSAIALSVVAFSGCGGGGSSSASQGSIVGSWSTGCKANDEGIYKKIDATFNSDGTGVYQKFVYTDSSCAVIDYTKGTKNFKYEIGKNEKCTDDKTAKQINIHMIKSNKTYYTLFRVKGDTLTLAGDAYGALGGSPEKRANSCVKPTVYKRVK